MRKKKADGVLTVYKVTAGSIPTEEGFFLNLDDIEPSLRLGFGPAYRDVKVTLGRTPGGNLKFDVTAVDTDHDVLVEESFFVKAYPLWGFPARIV